jgi:hypothetical protein
MRNNEEKKIALVDLDGIILEPVDGEYHQEKFGEVRQDSRWGIRMLKKLGYDIVVWTCRGNTILVQDYLERKKVPFDYINYHPLGFLKHAVSRKLPATIYIDDRGIGCPKTWKEIINKVRRRENEKD